MSTLDKLSIRGVRSFGTAQRDEQVISFSTPITLILGENGCGKTTIIECLKYALIGELPPGSSKGQSFVHDPKIFNVSESLAQVKLQVKNGSGDKITVCRSMKSSAAKRATGGLKFETLDSTINVVLNGKHESISKRCADTNIEMAHVMGVPKAIINNVLFCHQEDSSWPLDEAKKLKERFDEIFGTTEYNKAIDKILKCRKAYEAKAKEKESELNLLEHLKKDAESRTLDLSTAEAKLTKVEETVARCEESMKPIRERLDKIRSIELEITKLYTSKTEVATKLEKCEEHQKSLTAKIRKLHTGSTGQLDAEIAAFRAKTAERDAELVRLSSALADAKATDKQHQQQIADMDRRRTTLIVQRQQEQDLHDERAKHLQQLCAHLTITDAIPHDDLNACTPAEIESVLAEAQRRLTTEDGRIAALSVRHDRDDAELQTRIDRIRERRATVESDITAANRQAAQLRQELRKVQQKIAAVETTASKLKSVAAEIAQVDRALDAESSRCDADAERRKLDEQQRDIDELQDQLDVLDIDVSVMSTNAKLSAELGLKRGSLEQREADVRRLRHKNGDHLKRLFTDGVPEDQYKRRMQTVCDALKRQQAEGQKRVTGAQKEMAELQVTRRTQRAELQRAEKELCEAEERLYEQCQSQAYADVVGRVKSTVDKLQLDHGALNASQVLYAKYMQKMSADPCCPLCHKDMTSTERDDLTAEMHDELRRLPDKLATAERQLHAEQRKYETLLGLASHNDRIGALRSAEIPRQKTALGTTETRLAAVTADAENLQMALAEPGADLELAQSLMGDMTLLDEAGRDVQTLTAQVNDMQRRLPERSSTLTLEQAQEQRAGLQRNVRTARVELERAQKALREGAERLNGLRERRNGLKASEIEMQEGVQALGEMRKRVVAVEADIAARVAEAAEREAILGPLRQEFDEATETKREARERNRRALAADGDRLVGWRRVEREVLRCGGELKRLAGQGLERQLERLASDLRDRTADQRRAAGVAEAAAARVDDVRTQIAGQELIERNLHDNRELRQLQDEAAALRAQQAELQRDLGDHDFRSVTREKDGLVERSDAIQMERSECVGQMGELRARVRTLRAELALPKYQNAVRTYLQTYYDAVLLRKMCKDLGTYRLGLEWALMNFHTEKMEKINQLVKGLWHKIYRGNDIDYIQIRTDEMKVQNVDKRRSYDYRVVQIKNDSELDMRGRCSAGQRVLACLIIRIALAETFSSNCGVLTLDEPTTNLDRVNIVSLCQALNAIVEERQLQSNFMLVVITHDEEFITTLGRIENYWKVSRDKTGKSVIEMINVE